MLGLIECSCDGNGVVGLSLKMCFFWNSDDEMDFKIGDGVIVVFGVIGVVAVIMVGVDLVVGVG